MSVAHCVYCPNLKHELEDSNRSSWQHSCDSQQWDSVASVHYTPPTHTHVYTQVCMHAKWSHKGSTCATQSHMWCLQCIGVTSNTVPRIIFCQGSGSEQHLIRNAYVTSSCLRQFPLSSSIIENIPRHHKIISNLLYIVNQKDLGNNPKQKQYYFLPKEGNPNRSM